jgi:hypothetical protein
MKQYILVILISYTTITFAKLNTQFNWARNSNNLFSGKCFEIDTETQGQKYSNKVDEDLCRPEKTIFLFLYKQRSCYEVDSETRGEFYLKKVKLQLCRTKMTKTFLGSIQGTYGCFEIDTPSDGKNYYKKIKSTACIDLDVTYTFMQTKVPFGKCYAKNIEGKLTNVDLKLCKTKKTKYTFIKKSDIKGICIEHDIRGYEFYAKSVNIDLCKTKNTVFVFLKKKKSPSGTCYEVDKPSNGEKYINKVLLKLCK